MDEVFGITETTDLENNGVDSDLTQKYLTFLSDKLIYGIHIEHVTEIITNHSVTMLPRLPDYIKGIINLRGQIIPIIDIRLKMNKPEVDHTSVTCIIVLEVDNISIGILVDEVLQVYNVENNISAPPSRNHEFVSGVSTLSDGSVMFCLDTELLVNSK